MTWRGDVIIWITVDLNSLVNQKWSMVISPMGVVHIPLWLKINILDTYYLSAYWQIIAINCWLQVILPCLYLLEQWQLGWLKWCRIDRWATTSVTGIHRSWPPCCDASLGSHCCCRRRRVQRWDWAWWVRSTLWEPHLASKGEPAMEKGQSDLFIHTLWYNQW